MLLPCMRHFGYRSSWPPPPPNTPNTPNTLATPLRSLSIFELWQQHVDIVIFSRLNRLDFEEAFAPRSGVHYESSFPAGQQTPLL